MERKELEQALEQKRIAHKAQQQAVDKQQGEYYPSRTSSRRSRFSRVWRMRISVSLRRSLYLVTPAASSI
jgi:hypothetical protein